MIPTAFNCNRYSADRTKDPEMIYREQRVLEMVYYSILERQHEEKEHEII